MPDESSLLNLSTKTSLPCRFRGIDEDSGIARMYHSLASILADGSVYIGGSNPNNLIVNDGPYPTEFRTQRFIPDYLQSGAQQNTIQVSRAVSILL